MAVTLSGAARQLGLPDNRQVRGIVEFLGITLRRVGNQLHISDNDFEAIELFMRDPRRVRFEKFKTTIRHDTTRHDTKGSDDGQDW